MKEVPNPNFNPDNNQRSQRLDKPLEENMNKDRTSSSSFEFQPRFAIGAQKEVFENGPEARRDYIHWILMIRRRKGLMSSLEQGAVLEIMVNLLDRREDMVRALWRLYDPDYQGRSWGRSSGADDPRWVWECPPFMGLCELIVHGRWFEGLRTGLLTLERHVSAETVLGVAARVGETHPGFQEYALNLFATWGLKYDGTF